MMAASPSMCTMSVAPRRAGLNDGQGVPTEPLRLEHAQVLLAILVPRPHVQVHRCSALLRPARGQSLDAGGGDGEVPGRGRGDLGGRQEVVAPKGHLGHGGVLSAVKNVGRHCRCLDLVELLLYQRPELGSRHPPFRQLPMQVLHVLPHVVDRVRSARGLHKDMVRREARHAPHAHRQKGGHRGRSHDALPKEVLDGIRKRLVVREAHQD
mmetsp:Transcript_166452/g.528816  ORF Transcript_166452/g.528816 Transcript_166452/m.528816 type:complete len:210 (-) Transcript_166452:394-1023(-)